MRRTRQALQRAVAAWLVCCVAAGAIADAQRSPRSRRRGGGDSQEALRDYKAGQMLKHGQELIEEGQEERGLRLIGDIPRMFPTSPVRFRAYAALAQRYMQRGSYDLALRQCTLLMESEDPEHQAEALYNRGICHYSLDDFDKAFIALRKVTNQFPWSVYANEAFYYIGQCHFRLGRWNKAVEALEMVGTSVPLEAEGRPAVEAGQRIFVKVNDRDLVVMKDAGETFTVELEAGTGDREMLELVPLGKSGQYYIGSMQSELGEPVPGDGRLQIIGGDEIKVLYRDANTEAGERDRQVVSTARLVSTAAVGFTDGAFKDYVKGVFADTDCFVRVKDLDHDRTDEPEQIAVRLYTRYQVREERDPELAGVQIGESDEPEFVERDAVNLTLTETGPHTGIFTGSTVPRLVRDQGDVIQGDDVLAAAAGDEVVLECTDDAHLGGADPRDVQVAARLLVGQIQDVRIEHRVVPTLDLKARKDLIEAKIFLRLGTVFKDVGLQRKASQKADQGLERVEEVIRTSTKASLERSLVEEAFSIKWDLLLVQNKLREAINVCRTLMRMFPDSTLVDKALFKIGKARLEEGELNEALRIFRAVTALEKSGLKAEAQFTIAGAMETGAFEAARRSGRAADLSRAMLEYKKCADAYPDSPFAGQAIGKIADYYLSTKDYARVAELMEGVFQDYPDASFLDQMLLKWALAAYRLGDLKLAQRKLEQFLDEYPASPLVTKARQFKKIVDARAER